MLKTSKSNEQWLEPIIPDILADINKSEALLIEVGHRIEWLRMFKTPHNRSELIKPLNNRDLAAIMNMSPQNYPRMEGAFHTPKEQHSLTVHQVSQICAIYKVSADWLLFGKRMYAFPGEEENKPKNLMDLEACNKRILELQKDKENLQKLVDSLERQIQELKEK